MQRASIALIVLSCALTAHASPVQWTVESGGNGHWYEVIVVGDTPTTWYDARDQSSAMTYLGQPGHLATLTSAEENAFVAGLLSGDTGKHTYWIGGSQAPGSAEPDDGWGWVTGEEWSYTNWESGEPNQAGNNEEDTLYIYGPNPPDASWPQHVIGAWNDIAFLALPIPNYIVEYEVPEPATLGLLALGGVMILKRRRAQ